MNDAGDGLVYASIGLRTDTPSSNKIVEPSSGVFTGNLSAAIPARAGISTRFRMPFLPDTGRSAAAVANVLHQPRRLHQHGRRRWQRSAHPWQSGMATIDRLLSVCASGRGPRASRSIATASVIS